jgi:hypothetical protein
MAVCFPSAKFGYPSAGIDGSCNQQVNTGEMLDFTKVGILPNN